ncbi:glycosyltransferase family 2 protein [Algibacillus agarilyticus]|uniref:glycosyltransferase family 2 protein n=1 Tax=Algibacillus agarilyticus TaxID=2234133 RepID=UPI000DD02A8B|nr:glycosyltransferase family A protein [Algibacillus agarilyticus]
MMDTNTQPVSVVITAYNRPDHLLESLNSVINQSIEIFEIIVVDDCSPTPLKKIIDEFPNSNIRYLKSEENLGANHSRNVGINHANGEWIAFLDDDDVWLPNKIELQLLSLNSVQDAIGATCSYKFLNDGRDRDSMPNGTVVELEKLKVTNSYCGTSGFIVKREVLLKTLFDEELPCGQDWDMLIRLCLIGKVLFDATPLFLYRIGSHEGITTKAKRLKVEDVYPRLKSAYKHRKWMGEKAFKQRVSAQILSFIFQKKNKIKWVLTSISIAGVNSTLIVLVNKIKNKIM